MSSSASSSSSIISTRTSSSGSVTSCTECYEVAYSVGPFAKQGNRIWHDGRLTYHGYNRKIFLRDMKANLVEEGFYLSQPKHATQKALGSGRSVPLFEAGGTYQLLDHYTVVIKKLKSTHEKVVDVVAMKQFALRKKDKKVCQRAKDLLMQAPDILADTLGKPQARRSMENLQSGKRSYSALTEVDVNDAASTENSNRSLESSRGSDFASEVESISKKLSEIVDSSRCRASGLSKKARRST